MNGAKDENKTTSVGNVSAVAKHQATVAGAKTLEGQMFNRVRMHSKSAASLTHQHERIHPVQPLGGILYMHRRHRRYRCRGINGITDGQSIQSMECQTERNRDSIIFVVRSVSAKELRRARERTKGCCTVVPHKIAMARSGQQLLCDSSTEFVIYPEDAGNLCNAGRFTYR